MSALDGIEQSLPSDRRSSVEKLGADDFPSLFRQVFQQSVLALVHYGSHVQGRGRDDSPYDYFLIVDDYRAAYTAAAQYDRSAFRPWLANCLAHLLPPNALRLQIGNGANGKVAKCLLIDKHHFLRECSSQAKDHFVAARMLQKIELAWAKDEIEANDIARAIASARDGSLRWALDFMPQIFDLEAYCRTLLQVSFASELRAEPNDHHVKLYLAQRTFLDGIYEAVLERAVVNGQLARRPTGEFVQLLPVSHIASFRRKAWFALSKFRTSVRLLKHPFLYSGWIDYLLDKVARSTGQHIELNTRERRWPWIFLWPRIVGYCLARAKGRQNR